MDTLLDIFNDDAFNLVTLTAAINKIDHVPGQAGALTFAGTGAGVATTDLAIEQKSTGLAIIPTTPRGAPAPQGRRAKGELRRISVPHIAKEQTIQASAVQNNRAFGTTALTSVQAVVNDEMAKLSAEMDLTLENLRLGALKGEIVDADGTTILNLFDAFGVSEPATVSFSDSDGTLRTKCQDTIRSMYRSAKIVIPAGAQVYALCGDDFFDELVAHDEVRAVYQNWQGAVAALGSNLTGNTGFNFGGINWVNYRGTDDVDGTEESDGSLTGSVGIVSGEARLFLTGIPGLYIERFAPADFLETVNAVGLPRYAKIAVDQEFGRYAKLHTQMNPIPLVTRPETLRKAVFA